MKFYRYLSWVIIGFSVVLALLGTASVADASATPITSASQTLVPTPSPAPNPAKDPSEAAQTSSPGVLEQFGPPGVIITTVLTGVLMIIKSINEGKKIDVTTYKERAADAEARSNEEIGKVHKKLGELEKKLDEVIADRDEYRDTLEERKAHFTQQVLDMERRHQRELEDMHSALMVEVHTRHKLERILAENGIRVPQTPPPYTRSMKEEVTVQDRVEASASTASMRIIRESEESTNILKE
jgi:hypothetical protein